MQIKAVLTAGKINFKQRETKNIKQYYNYYAIIPFIIGCLCLWGSYHFYISKGNQLTSDQLTTITSSITTTPEIRKSGKGSRSITFKLKGYPNFKFDLSGVNYNATNVEDFIATVNADDTVSVDITTEEYKKKLSKEEELSYLDKSVNYRFIYIYGLRAKQNSYLSLSDYNKENRSNNKLRIWLCGLLGLFFIGMATYQLKLTN